MCIDFNIEDYAKYRYVDVDEEKFDGYFISEDELVKLILGDNFIADDINSNDLAEDFEILTGFKLSKKDEYTQLRQILIQDEE